MANIDVLYIHPKGDYPEFSKKYYNEKNRNNAEHFFGFIPMGVIGILNNLAQNGIKVKGINLALKARVNPSFELEKCLETLEPRIVLIDMHWYVHIKNGIETAKICKKHGCTVVVGGLSATLFYKQLLKFEQIDYVVKGDAELPLLELCKAVLEGSEAGKVANTASKHADNKISYACIDIDRYDYVSLDFLEDRDSYLEMFDFWLMIGKGCPFNCEKCDGARLRTKEIFGRNRTIFRKPETIVKDLEKINTETVNFSLDMQLMPDEIIDAIGNKHFKLNLRNEFFRLADADKLKKIKNSFVSFDFVFSPVSADDKERKHYGRDFTNEEFLKVLKEIDEEDLNGGIIVYFTDHMISPKGTKKLNLGARKKLVKEIEKIVPYALIEIMPQIVDPGTLRDKIKMDELFRIYSS